MSRPAYPSLIKLHSVRAFFAGLVMMGLAGQSVAADDAKDQLDERWVPSVALAVGFTSQRFEGSVQSRNVVFGTVTSTLVRPDDFGQQYLNSIHAGGMFEILTPAIPIPHVRPRIFFGGEIHSVSSQLRKLAIERDPQTVITEPNITRPYGEVSILGVGSQTTVDADNLEFGAHVGISFPVQIGDLHLSIKPSARYLKQKLYFTGIVSSAQRPGVVQNEVTNRILLQGSDSTDVHAVGPGLEIEIEVGGARSLAASVFVSGGAYRVLSDEKIRFGTIGDGSDPPQLFTQYRADWAADLDPWIYRASVGLRIKWTGAERGWLFGLDR